MFDAQKTHGGVSPIPTVVPEPVHWEVAGQSGHRTLWVVFVIMVVASAVFAGLSWNVAIQRRIFYFLTTLTTIISALVYFSEASGHAVTFNCVRARDHHKHVPDTFHDACRQVYWARYVDWLLTFPILTFQLSLLAGIDGAHTIFAIIANIIWVLTGLFSAVGHANTAQKWGWYAISLVAYIFVIWHLALHGTQSARARGTNVAKLFGGLSGATFVLWTIYVVIWAALGNAWKTSVSTEIIVYAVLDVLIKVVVGTALIRASRQNRDTTPEVGGYWSTGVGAEGTIRVGDDEEGA